MDFHLHLDKALSASIMTLLLHIVCYPAVNILFIEIWLPNGKKKEDKTGKAFQKPFELKT